MSNLRTIKRIKASTLIRNASDLELLRRTIINSLRESYLKITDVECCEIYDYLLLMAIKLHKHNDVDLVKFLENFVDEDFRLHGLTPWGTYAKGIALWASGDFSEADHFFMQSASYGLKRRHGATGCYSRIPLGLANSLMQGRGFLSLGSDITYIDEWGNIPPGRGPILIASSDSQYFVRFALPFVKSAVNAGVDNIHLHIVDPDTCCFNIIDRIRECRNDVIFTYQNTTDLKLVPDKSFYACSRFVILPALLKLYRRPVVVSDIDVAICRDFNKKLVGLECYEIGLRMSGIPVPWLSVTGACVYLAGGSASIEFCSFVSRYISIMYDRTYNRDNWVLDQNALFSGYEGILYGLFGRSIEVANLSAREHRLVIPAQHLDGGKAAFSNSYSM